MGHHNLFLRRESGGIILKSLAGGLRLSSEPPEWSGDWAHLQSPDPRRGITSSEPASPLRGSVLMATPALPMFSNSHPCCRIASPSKTSLPILISLRSGQSKTRMAELRISQHPPGIKI